MINGSGMLVASGGKRVPVTYEFAETTENGRAGLLYCDTTDCDPGIFAETLFLECEDGTVLTVIVTLLNEQRLGFFGRPFSRAS